MVKPPRRRAGAMRAGVLAVLLLGPLLAGCMGTPPPAAPPTPLPPPPPGDEVILEAARAFRGHTAFNHVLAQVAGSCPPGTAPEGATCPRYRIPGTEGNNATARLLAESLAAMGLQVVWDNFTAAIDGRPVPAHNVGAQRSGSSGRTLYLGAHYDTRPCADKDPVGQNRTQPVLGANDGASGVAVLLHLLSLLQGRSLNLTLHVVFFDAEDAGDGGLGCGRATAWAQGSAHYAARLDDNEVGRALGMVLVDMPGDPALELRRERASAQAPHRALQDDLWAWAARLGHAQFRNETGPAILDDHTAFQRRGIRSVDVIHLDGGADPFPDSHHTTFDDLEHVSPASLEAVGETLLAAVLAWDRDEGQAAENPVK